MVKVVAAHLRQSGKGSFVLFEILGEIELLQSQKTGRFYATARRCMISTTFDAATANSFVGQSLPGSIGRVECEPYTYTVPESGEEVELAHKWDYVPEEKPLKSTNLAGHLSQ
jgi:hypothetical protein